MGKVFFPLDEELLLLPGHLAPRQQEHLVHLASFMPFGKAAQMMRELLAVPVHPETVRRCTQEMGACLQAAQTASAESPESRCLEPVLPRCVLSADGAMIPLQHGQWAEVRTLAIGEPEEQVNALGEPEIHVGKLSYFSQLADAISFTRLSQIEIQRRRVGEAGGKLGETPAGFWVKLRKSA